MISNRCARKSLVTNCNSIISKNYLRFLVDSNDPAIVKTFHQPVNRKFFFALFRRCSFSTAYRMATTNNIICRLLRTLYRKL